MIAYIRCLLVALKQWLVLFKDVEIPSEVDGERRFLVFADDPVQAMRSQIVPRVGVDGCRELRVSPWWFDPVWEVIARY